MKTEKTSQPRRPSKAALKAEDLLPALMCLERLVKELAPSLPSGATDEANDFVRAVGTLREKAHV
jgi:hypothetical protein